MFNVLVIVAVVLWLWSYIVTAMTAHELPDFVTKTSPILDDKFAELASCLRSE